MATKTLDVTYYKQSGTGSPNNYSNAGSKMVGCEGNRYRLLGFQFTTPNTGMCRFKFKMMGSFTTWDNKTSANCGAKLRYIVTTSSSVPAITTDSFGTITGTDTYISCDYKYKLLEPSTTYYLWIFPSEYYNGVWSYSEMTLTFDGGGVHIYDGSKWKTAIVWIYNGSSWKRALPWIYNGSSWKTTKT